MGYTAKDVVTLRERTGVGMKACKDALEASNGDMDKAIDFLREKGLAAAAKKAGRVAAEGLVKTYITEDNKTGTGLIVAIGTGERNYIIISLAILTISIITIALIDKKKQ